MIVLKSWFQGVIWLKRQGAWLRARRLGFILGCRRRGDFLHSFVSRLLLGSIQPAIECVPGVKAAERRTRHPTISQCRGCVYIGMCTLASTSPWAFMAYNGDTFYHGFLMCKCSACRYGFTMHRHLSRGCPSPAYYAFNSIQYIIQIMLFSVL